MAPDSVKSMSLESNSTASSESLLSPRSRTPSASTLIRTSGFDSFGSRNSMRAKRITRTGSGSSSTTATDALSFGGVPQPISAIGPNRKRPGAVGKSASSCAKIAGALVIAFFGNSTDESCPAFSAACNASVEAVRWTASRPPTPFSVKPQPSCTGGNSASTKASSE
jgi:hypothetical protein